MAEVTPAATAVPARPNPFPGLRPFRTDEEHLFFGREQQIDRMVDKLAQRRFLAVVGTSGSGKSSLVNCGLRPALHRGYMAGAGADWRMATCHPGHDPLGALARALAAPGVLFEHPAKAADASGMTSEELVRGTLRMSGLGLVDIVRQARLPAGCNLLLVVDQFEELFRYHGRGDGGAGDGAAAYGPGPQARGFVTLLLEAVAQPALPALPIHIVLTMRSDYLGDCAQFHGLPEVMNEGQYLVPRLARDEIRAAITGPVSLSGATISPVLLTRLLNDVGDNPDQLSILQHALNRTWAHWANEGGGRGPLGLADYEAIGGMREALDRHAEKAFAELAAGEPAVAAGQPSPRQRLAAQLFRAITDKGTDARGIRRPTALAELGAITGASVAEISSVLAMFRKASRSFLMPPEGEPLQPDTRIDISHESLMRVWRRLDRWADDEAAAARQYHRLAESATLFNRGDAGLLNDRELDLALEWRHQTRPNAAWAAQYGGQFEAVDGFIQRSRALRLAERVEAELDRLWRSCGRLAVIAVVGLMFVVGQIWLNQQMSSLLAGDQLAGRLARLGETTGVWRWLIEVLAHVLVGLPALLLYDLLEPVGRRLHARRARDAVSRRVAAEADTASQQRAEAVAPAAVAAVAAAGVSPGAAADPDAQAAREALAWTRDPAARAGYPRRLLAGLIDLGLAGVIWFFSIGFGIETGWISGPDQDGFTTVTLLAMTGLGLMSARSACSPRQGSLGKRLLGLVVTDTEGRRLGFGRAFSRYVAKLLSYWLFLLGFALALLGARRQTLHDRVAGTLVLRRQPAPVPHASEVLRRAAALQRSA